MSVIIPAYNAEKTVDATLGSVRAQSHSEIEVIVVNDGSTDRTADRVLRHVREDARVRLVEQDNAGVAAARNRGMTESRSDLITPVDADDLWHPDKVSRQLQVISASNNVGLVATAYSVIDEANRVIGWLGGTFPKTADFRSLCRRNFIGNGSSALFRRSLAERFGGYDSSLRARGGQGCEDLQLYLQIAEFADIALIRKPLTAYRRGATNMSGNSLEMLRSFDLVASGISNRRPEMRSLLNDHRTFMLCWLIAGALRSGNLSQSTTLIGQLLSTPSTALPEAVLGVIGRRLTKAMQQLRHPEKKRPMLQWF